MKGFLPCVASSALIILPGLVRGQPSSCYTTTTIVFGDPQSVLSSLLMVSNMTSITPATVASTPASFPASISSTTSSTSTSISPAVTGLFPITVNVPGPKKLRTRGIEYVSFSGTTGVLVTDPSQATLFKLVNGYLETSMGLYVEASTSGGFETSSIQPTDGQALTVNSDGSVSVNGGTDFCYTPDGELYVVTAGQSPSDCTVATLAAAPADASPTSLAVSSQAAATSSVSIFTSLSSSAPVAPTSNVPNLLSTFEGSAQQASIASLHSQSRDAVAPPPLTSSTSSNVAPSSSKPIPSTSNLAPPTSTTIILSSSGTSSRAVASLSTTVVPPPTSIVGPGQLSSLVSSIFSVPIVVSSFVPSSVPPTPSSVASLVSSSSAFSSSSRTSSPGTQSSSLIASSIFTSSSTSALSSSSSVISTPFTPVTSSSSGVTSPSSSVLGATSNTASSSTSSLSSTTSTTSSTLASSSNPLITTSSSTILSTSLSTTSSTSLTSSLAALPSPYQRNTGKRGLAYTNVTLTQFYSLQGQNSQVSWAYDYFSLPNASDDTGPTNPALTFIPLLYNDASSLTSVWATNVAYSIAHYGTDAIFSFNEPDACYSGQSACMSVNRSVAGYQKFMQPFAGQVSLGAPAVTNGGPPSSLTYLGWFLGNCTGCTVDFINLHWYSSPYSFSYLQSYIQQAYSVGGGRPIYLTEFGMDSYYYAEADVGMFLKNATTWLDAQSYVKRYSWFGDFAQTGPVGVKQGFGYLVNNASTGLSAEGVIWNNYTGGYVKCPTTAC